LVKESQPGLACIPGFDQDTKKSWLSIGLWIVGVALSRKYRGAGCEEKEILKNIN
jgi:hypothetical protein